jgi:hypothetical protein
MICELTTIPLKRFLLSILSGLFLTLFLSAGLALLTGNEEWVLLIFPGLLLTFILGHKLGRKQVLFNFENEAFFTLNENPVFYRDLTGYYINESGLTQSSLGLRLSTRKTIHLTASKSRKDGSNFRDFKETLIARIKQQNPAFREMGYREVYVKEGKALRWLMIVFAILIFILDIFMVFSLLSGQFNLPWQIFFINALFLGLMPYLRKNKA